MSTIKQKIAATGDQKRKRQRKEYDGFDFDWYFGSNAGAS
jgi:hypothetical protein